MVSQQVSGPVFLSLLGWVGVAQAMVSPEGTPPRVLVVDQAPRPVAASGRVEGEVVWVNPTGGVVEVKTAWFVNATRFFVAEQTLIQEGRYPLDLCDLAPGDQVAIRYTASDGRRIVQSILKR